MMIGISWCRKARRGLRAFGRLAARDDAGVEIFEFALVLPLLATLLLGIVWIGRAYNVYQTITRAAREGARYAVLPNCASCGNNMTDTYASAGTASNPACLTNPTSTFTNYVSPALSASGLDPTQVSNYCQEAAVLNSSSDASVKQCGVVISFAYPVQLAIPFTSFNATPVSIHTQVQMRMENQSVDSLGNPTCP
ncbi:MAG TPA: TadE/TadG family type IV pilus assembly protein [Terriglobia bacterium]|nr:TadE/TadG family type IV pilus assembly protein [Terriglobia bacterium]